MNLDVEKLRRNIEHPYPLLFVTVSGAHLYGFPSADSDYDLRGVHLLPLPDLLGLDSGEATVEQSEIKNGMEFDLVTHDAAKFFRLLLKKNGYVLEQLYSPLIVQAEPEHKELKEIAKGCITRFHAHHYLGFVSTQWKLFEKEQPPRVKPLLYVYRVLLTGIHLMQTGEVEANLVTLNRKFGLSHLDELIARKIDGAEKGAAEGIDIDFHRREYERLMTLLEAERDRSALPEAPSAKAALNDLLVRLRLCQGDR